MKIWWLAHVKKLDQYRTVKKKKIAVVRPIVPKGLSSPAVRKYPRNTSNRSTLVSASAVGVRPLLLLFISVQVQRYSVGSRYPLTYGSPWNFGNEADPT